MKRGRKAVESFDVPREIHETAVREAKQVLQDNMHRVNLDDVLGFIWLRGAIQGGLVALDVTDKNRLPSDAGVTSWL